ncbi:MAG: hypothetical protein M3332_15140 [Actinomycetota bacterium]|nr:hypothetical protein [Actinomycetota bacterium]
MGSTDFVATALLLAWLALVAVLISFAEVRMTAIPDPDLLDLALRPATTPRGPRYGRDVSSDRELGAFLRLLVT